MTVSLSDASSVGVSVVPSTQAGGNWLSVDRSSLTVGTSGASFNFTVNATVLAPGSYLGFVTVNCLSGATCNPATLSIVTIVPGISALLPGATSFTLSTPSALQGRASIFSTDGSTLAFTATVAPGSAWLQVSQTSTATPCDIVVTASAGSLAAGTYNGTVLLTAASGAPPVPIPVTFAVTGSGGGGGGGGGFSISVNPPALQIQAVSAKKTFTFPQVRATGSGTASLSIASTTDPGTHWLSATLSSSTITGGGNPVNVTVTADPTKFDTPPDTPATFTGTITITASPGNTVTISVTFIVYSGADTTTSPDPLVFTLVPGQKLPIAVTVTTSAPVQTIVYDDSSKFVNVPPASWLSASASGFTITVIADASSLAPGPYSASIKVSGKADGSQLYATLHVTATVGTTAPLVVSVDQTSLSFPLSAGGGAGQKTINVTAASATSFSAAVTSGSPWLQASANGSATPAALAVTAAPGSMAPGSYNGNIRITPAGSAFIDVPVTMTLTATAALSLDSAPIVLAAQTGGACAPKNLAISSSAGGIVLPYATQAAIQSPAGGTWLTVGSPNGNTPASISVSCNSSGLAVGNYSGSLSIASPLATNSPVTIPVTLNVTSGTSISASPASVGLSLSAGGACSSQQVAVSSTAPSSGVSWSATSAVTSGSNWITITGGSGSTPGAFTVSCSGAGLRAGSYNGSVTVSAGSASATVNISLVVSDTLIVSAASGDTRLASGMIASIFGDNLAAATVIVSTPTTSAGGITVSVRDSAGATRSAPLFYVSPKQVNFDIPEATAGGAATITVNGASGALATANVQIFNVAPGIFTMTGLPAGPAAALAAFYDANGQPLGPADAFRCTPAGCTTFPLDVNAGPQLVVSVYGTGFHRASMFTVRIGSTNVTVLGVAPSPQFVGEDQINILIPKSLAGAGDVALVMTADGVASNGPHLNLK